MHGLSIRLLLTLLSSFLLPCFFLVPPIVSVSIPHGFRILSVLFPLLEARMIEQRKKEERRKNEGRYGNNTGLIRDRYETERLPSEEEGEYFNFFIMVG